MARTEDTPQRTRAPAPDVGEAWDAADEAQIGVEADTAA
jgi:hypothetical protein